MSLNESIIEDAALTWFRELGYAVGYGSAFARLRRDKPQLAPGEPAAERDSFGEVVLVAHLREAIRRMNPAIAAATKAGKEMGLTDDEKAFYDALAANDSAVTAMGDAKLKVIAAELITQVKKSVTIDWTLRESARAKIKVMVKRILNKHGYASSRPDLMASRASEAGV
jgi:hypothetical protein